MSEAISNGQQGMTKSNGQQGMTKSNGQQGMTKSNGQVKGDIQEAMINKEVKSGGDMATEGTKSIRFDLQERLVDYAVRIIKLSDALHKTAAGEHVSSQLLRSGTSPAANYGEAQGAESRADFVHKLKLSLKELRETEVWLKIILRAGLISSPHKLEPLVKETDELIAIIFTSITTAKSKN